ncbi:MAG TPA: PAS domain S-box protein, partial [Candidatus Acidoferrales bacterium]|nr:PAS domain S-box protein [Candidatus Acidoferrales bacterium]
YSHPNEISRDEVELKDGTILDRYSSPVIGKDGKHYGRIWSFRDITEQKVSEEALHESEAKFRSYVENAPLAVLVADQKRRVVDCNPAAADLLGYDVAALLSTPITDLHPEDDAEKVFQSLQTLATEGHAEGEFRFKRRDGTLIWVSLRAVLTGSGLSIAFCQDITERRVAAEAIANERQLLRTLIDLLPDTFYVKDLDSRFLIANKALAKHFGKEFPSEIVGRTDADFFPPECAAEYRAAELKVLGGEPLIDYEGDGIGPTGRRCTHLTTKVPFRDSQGRVQGLVGIGRDITERKRSEESHQRLATAVEQAAEAVVISDTDGKILYVNPAFETVTGYSKGEVIGRNPRFLKSGKHDNLFYRRMWAVLANGEVWSGRLVNKKKDGTLFEEEANISPVRDSNGRITNYVAVKRDVTREVMLENQFRQSQKMEAFGQLAGGVAHDFNNLLTVIQGSGSLLLNPQLNPEEKAGCSRQIVQAAERAASLTRQLLMFSRKHVLQVDTINLNEVVGNMTKMLQRILGEDIVLHAEYDPKIAAVSADAGMLEQVLLNLAVNSRDAMPKGGRLLIATSRENLGAGHPQMPVDMAPGTYVCLKVTDTGCGIAPEVLPHIFEPFFTTKETGKGTGLGLATVYGIIQQHHGWVTVSSEPGRGATFYVYLPAAAGAPAQVEAASPPKLPRGTETILLTEDEPAVRALASNILRRCGYTILPAESGVAALEIWHEYRDKIQLLLTDIIMPDGITGYDLAEQLKLERPQLKVIYTSGYTGDILSRYPTLIRDYCFLQKPYQPYRLAQTVRDCLDQEPDGDG